MKTYIRPLLFAGLLMAIGIAGHNGVFSSAVSPSTTTRTIPQTPSHITNRKYDGDVALIQVQAAIQNYSSCDPRPRDIHLAGSDKTGTLYFVGCGEWIYDVFFGRDDSVRVMRLTRWNGIN
jgi:hypothetical protein